MCAKLNTGTGLVAIQQLFSKQKWLYGRIFQLIKKKIRKERKREREGGANARRGGQRDGRGLKDGDGHVVW